LRGVPGRIVLNADAIVTTDGLAVAVANGTIGSLDVVLRNPSGVLGTASTRIRARAEQVPVLLRVDIDDAEADTMTVSTLAAGRVGRVLVEASAPGLAAGERQFGLPMRDILVQLADLPERVEVVVHTPADSDLVDVQVDAIDNVPGTGPGDAIGRVELQATRTVLDDRGAALARFTDPAFGRVDRSAFTARIDDDYWPTTERGQLDALYGVGMPLPIETVDVGIAPDGAGGGTRTAARQDHAIVAGLSRGFGFDVERIELISLALSDVATVEVSVNRPDGHVVDIRRAAGSTPSSLFLGVDQPALADGYATPSFPFSLISLIGSDPGAPAAPSSGWQAFTMRSDTTGPFEFDPLAGTEGFLASTVEVVVAPQRGTATVTDGRIAYHTAQPGQVGHDVLAVRACNAAAQCTTWLAGVAVVEPYRRATAIQLVSPPEHLAATIETIEGSVSVIGLDASTVLGPMEIYDGPIAPLAYGGTHPDARQRGDAPVRRLRANVDSPDLRIDLTDGGGSFAGRYALDASGLLTVVGVVGGEKQRTFVALVGEDIAVSLRKQGTMVDEDRDAAAGYAGAGSCDDWFDTGCWLLYRIQVDITGLGDVTGARASGAVAQYLMVDLHPDAGTGRDFVPRWTSWFRGLERAAAGLDVEVDLFCGICLPYPIDVEWDVVDRVDLVEYGFWDLGLDLCLPLLDDVCIEADGPDYLDGVPWNFDLLTAPLTRILPPSAPPANGPPLALDTTVVDDGDTVRIILPAGTTAYQVLLYSTPVELAAGEANGAAEVTVTIPADTAPGEHTLVLRAYTPQGMVVQHATLWVGPTQRAITIVGFGSPVSTTPADAEEVTWNVMRGGRTLPLKFSVFEGTEPVTDIASIGGVRIHRVACEGTGTGDLFDVIRDNETLSAGSTALRYDTASGQFIQNWRTPKVTGPELCYRVEASAGDDLIRAFVRLTR
jgi:hypothetical protein